jgi:hypothetical protein
MSLPRYRNLVLALCLRRTSQKPFFESSAPDDFNLIEAAIAH